MNKRIGRQGKGEGKTGMVKDFTDILCDLGIINITLFTTTRNTLPTGRVTSEQD